MPTVAADGGDAPNLENPFLRRGKSPGASRIDIHTSARGASMGCLKKFEIRSSTAVYSTTTGTRAIALSSSSKSRVLWE